MIQRRLDAGETIIGKKIGVTSKVVMDMLKVDQPDFGMMTSGMVFNEGESIDTSTMIAPAPKPKPFVLKSDLMGPGVTAADVLRATDFVVPCFEIVDSRIQDWKIKIQDTVADNASCGVLCSRPPQEPARHRPGAGRHGSREERRNHQHLHRRRRAGLPGERRGLAGQHARPPGHPLKAGEVILSGSQSRWSRSRPATASFAPSAASGTSVRFI